MSPHTETRDNFNQNELNSSMSIQKISVQRIAFLDEVSPDQQVILELHNPVNKKAVLKSIETANQITPTSYDFELMTITVTDIDNPEKLSMAKQWIGESPQPIVLLSLQGTQILWSLEKVACIVKPERVETVQKAIIETYWYESELRSIEKEIQKSWDSLNLDAPLAFEFNEKAIRRRPELMKRFQKVINLRAKVARLMPHILAPVIYPPTLASQINERLRERTRMPDRVEFVTSQLEVYERVYESCSQRGSEYMLTRSSLTLEWYIIILLFIQIILTLVELLSHTRG